MQATPRCQQWLAGSPPQLLEEQKVGLAMWDQATKPQCPTFSSRIPLPKSSTSFHKSVVTGDHVLKCMNLWGASHIQTTPGTGKSLEITGSSASEMEGVEGPASPSHLHCAMGPYLALK